MEARGLDSSSGSAHMALVCDVTPVCLVLLSCEGQWGREGQCEWARTRRVCSSVKGSSLPSQVRMLKNVGLGSMENCWSEPKTLGTILRVLGTGWRGLLENRRFWGT